MYLYHQEKHPMAGKVMRIKREAQHFQYPDFGGSEFYVEDWWDRLMNESWMNCMGNMACEAYATRSAIEDLPLDNEVVYGKVGMFGSIVHVSELEEIEDEPKV